MSAQDWLRAAKAEEQRLLREIMKTVFFKQLEAVRTVIAVYEGTPESAAAKEPEAAARAISTRANGPASQHSFKVANAITEVSGAAGDATRSKPQ
jgi:hypothetical protein